MELDFKSIRALSSPTRLKILRKVLENDSTTTQLSDELDLSKSTVSSHLKDLTEAGLLEKDKREGRRRVVYSSTRKADAILKGKERKVKFSVASSVFSAVFGTFLILRNLKQKTAEKVSEEGPEVARSLSEEEGGSGGFNVMEAGNRTSEVVNNTTQKAVESFQGSGIEDALLFIGIGLLGISASTLIYGLALRHLGSSVSEEKKVEVK